MKLRRPEIHEIALVIAAAVFFAAAVYGAHYDLMMNGGK
jgi:hypothetical protein